MKMQHTLIVSGIALLAVAALSACAPSKVQQVVEGTPPLDEQVKGYVHICSSCHGFDGNSVSPTFPKLAGQQKDYLVNQLTAFRDHTRGDPHAHTYMWGMAAHLTDAQINGLATYFSSQRMRPGQPNDPTEMEAGKKLFAEGDPDHDVPACQACHGENGEGNGVYPRLASQHREYLIEQLGHFATNSRANEIMHQNAKPMTKEQIRDVTAYLSSL